MELRVKKTSAKLKQQGDTIVEVLIAIAIAAFAVGISYATAERSLDQAISAREHNEALNILENQVADLRLRFQKDTDFTSNFAGKSNFCLSDSAKVSTATGWFNQNQAITNSNGTTASAYSTGCQQQRTGEGAVYLANITTSGGTDSTTNPTLYTITVRWARLGGGTNKASLFYKLNYDPSATLGLPNNSLALNGNAGFNIDNGAPSPGPLTYSYRGSFTNTSTNPPSEVAGCTWNWGDGTKTTNTACQNQDPISHLFVYLPYSNSVPPDPFIPPPCVKTFTVVLTVTLTDGSTWTSPPSPIQKPSGSEVKANNIPPC